MEPSKRVTAVELYATGTGFYLCLTVALQAYSVTFLAPNVPFECVQRFNESIFHANHSKCDEYYCEKWEYHHTEFQSTLTEKLNLVCDKSWLISLGNSLNMAGDAIGCFIFGYLADRFGRKPTLLGCSTLAAVSHVMFLFVQNFNMFIAARFFTGMGAYGIMNAIYVLVAEIVQTKNRTVAGLIGQSGWTCGEIFLFIVAYLNRDWFFIQLFITVAAAILPIFIWFLPESPRWLMQKRETASSKYKTMEIKSVHSKCSSNQTIVRDKTENLERHYTIVDLFKTPNLRKWSFVIFLYWLSIGFTYFGISLNSGIFGSSLFLNFFLTAVVEFPSLFLTLFLDRFTGRKFTLALYMIGAGVFLILVILVGDGENWLITTFVVVGKLFITSAFYLVYVYTAELFPTVVRSVGFGSSSMFCRLGSIMAPFVKELSEVAGLWVPMAIFGFLCLTSGSLVIMLPETKGMILWDTIEETEQVISGKFFKKGKLELTESPNAHSFENIDKNNLSMPVVYGVTSSGNQNKR